MAPRPACRRSDRVSDRQRARVRAWESMWWAAPLPPTSYRIKPAEPDGIALAGQQRRGLVERQAHDIGIRAHDLDDKTARNALRGVAAGLFAPFAGRKIGLDVFLRE